MGAKANCPARIVGNFGARMTATLTPYQLDWLRANNPAFAHIEKTTGEVIRNARREADRRLAESKPLDNAVKRD